MTLIQAALLRRAGLRLSVLATVAIVVVAVSAVVSIWPDGFYVFHAPWLLHPFEQEHLTMARNLAHGGGFSISGEAYDPAYGSEDRGYVNGNFVMRSVPLPYLIYALPFLISDEAWLLVTPLFGLLCVLAVAVLVSSRTGSVPAAVAAGAALLGTAPFLLAISGVAYESVIALAFLLWGVVALEAFLGRPSLPSGALTGILFAGAALSRADYAPAAVACIAVIGGWLALRRLRRHDIAPEVLLAARLLIGGAALGVLAIFAVNLSITGDPLKTAYGESQWLGSAAGVATGIGLFSFDAFFAQAKLFLWQIAEPMLPLLITGGIALFVLNRLRAGDLVLAALCLFLAVLHLGRMGSHASDEPLLVASVPRYVLPVYATAAIMGFTAAGELGRRLRPRGPLVLAAAVLALGAIVASLGVREAYANRAGLPVIDRSLQPLRAAHEFSAHYPDALFVGDTGTKGIIVTPRTLIPRLVANQAYVVDVVKRELAAGRRVFVMDDPARVPRQPPHTGYVAALQAAGLDVCPVLGDAYPASAVVERSRTAGEPWSVVMVPATARDGVDGPALERGRAYFVVVSGVFSFNRVGERHDGRFLTIDGRTPWSVPSDEERYCAVVAGDGSAPRLLIADSVYDDNAGGVTLSVFPADNLK